MKIPMIISIDTRRIVDWDSFHDVFAEIFGFPDFYGHNMNAWIDCMTYLDEADDGLSRVKVPTGSVLTLKLVHFNDLRSRLPEIGSALIDGIAFVNNRRIEAQEPSVLTIAYSSR